MSDSPTPAVPIDWTALIEELNALAVASLGKRAQKVSTVLAAANLSEAGIESAINQIARKTIVSVDPVRLADLAEEMKVRLAARCGKPMPAQQSKAPHWTEDYVDAGVLAALGDSGGCLGSTMLYLTVVAGSVVVVESVLAAQFAGLSGR